jgi:hypothetical protein
MPLRPAEIAESLTRTLREIETILDASGSDSERMLKIRDVIKGTSYVPALSAFTPKWTTPSINPSQASDGR